jgi:multidrug resistance efflux pump
MNKSFFHFMILFSLVILAGCQSQKPKTTQLAEQAGSSAQGNGPSVISVEGRVVPRVTLNLAFSLNGRVGEVLVQEGETVQASQVIARLGNRQQAEVAVRAAELELITAQQTLKALSDNQDEVVNRALLAVNNARQAVEDAQRYLDSITGYPLQNEIAGAKAQVILAENQLESAQDKYENYQERVETDKVRANARVSLTEAQRAYNDAVKHLDDLQGDGYNFILKQAQTALDVAKEELVLAEENINKVKNGPDPDALALAEARRIAAEANLASAQAGLGQFELRAPIAGILVESGLQVGQQVIPGMTVVKLVDVSEWFIETQDLTEMDVVNVQVGQTVQVAADALPDVKLTGRVSSISDFYREMRGDITYVSRIKLDQADPRLRWGMTVMVTFVEP